LPANALSAAIVLGGSALAAAALIDAGRRAGTKTSPREQLMWALATAAFLLARQAAVTMPGGFTLQYLGAAWLTLLLGYPRAVVSVAAVMAIEALAGARAATTLGLGILLFAVTPAWLMWAIAHFCRRHLPPNPFVFLIGVGFLGLFAAYTLPLLVAAGIDAWMLGASPPDASGDAAAGHALAQYLRLALPYALLLSAGEAWIEGMLTTLIVVFAPGTMRLFDEAYYLARR